MKAEDSLVKTRHSLAHVLAMAVRDYDPAVKIAIGPVTDTGFYYDFQFSEGKTLNETELPKLEKKMRDILKVGFEPICAEISEQEARKQFKDQPYKLELIEEISTAGEKIATYAIDDSPSESAETLRDLLRTGRTSTTLIRFANLNFEEKTSGTAGTDYVNCVMEPGFPREIEIVFLDGRAPEQAIQVQLREINFA